MEIDLNKNLVIPLPEGFSMEQAATISAEFNKWEEKILSDIERDFEGLVIDFEAETINKEIVIINIENINEETIKVVYQEKIFVDNPISKVEFGKAKAVKQIGDYFRNMMLWKNTQKLELKKKELEALEKATKETLSEKLEELIGNIKAL